MPMRCCPECFGDRGLRKNIIPSVSPTRGQCDFCGSIDVDLIEPGKLANVFEMLASVYESDSDGKPLVEWMKSDWHLFSHPRLDDARANELLNCIFDDDAISGKTFAPSASYKSEALARWETLRNVLIFTPLYFVDDALDAD